MANHALVTRTDTRLWLREQRTLRDARHCNPCVPCAGSLNLGLQATPRALFP
jgi:hypothetical protein